MLIGPLITSAIRKGSVDIVKLLWPVHNKKVIAGFPARPEIDKIYTNNKTLAVATERPSPSMVLALSREGCYPDPSTTIDITETLNLALQSRDESVISGILKLWKANGVYCDTWALQSCYEFFKNRPKIFLI
jgi:hypothetical protein